MRRFSGSNSIQKEFQVGGAWKPERVKALRGISFDLNRGPRRWDWVGEIGLREVDVGARDVAVARRLRR